MLKPGTVIDKYEVLAPVEAGGMGMVYRARHTILDADVAIKILLPNLATKEKVRYRFQQEAYVQAQLSHPNIVRVTDFLDDEDILGFVMEWIQGPSLEGVLSAERPGIMPLGEVLEVLGQVLAAVAYAHARGVVHRDLKPANVMLDRAVGDSSLGTPKVADFGLAKILTTEVGMTRAGAQMGTTGYMAPEQFRGITDVDSRADVFALGMMTWRMLAGRLPVDPEDMMAVMALDSGQTPVDPIGSIVSDLPAALQTMVGAALSVDRDGRPADAGTMMRTLAESGVLQHAQPGMASSQTAAESNPPSPPTPALVGPPTDPDTIDDSRIAPGSLSREAVQREGPPSESAPQPPPSPARPSTLPMLTGLVVGASIAVALLAGALWLVMSRQERGKALLSAQRRPPKSEPFATTIKRIPNVVPKSAGSSSHGAPRAYRRLRTPPKTRRQVRMQAPRPKPPPKVVRTAVRAKPRPRRPNATHEVFDTRKEKEPWLHLRSRPHRWSRILGKMRDGTPLRVLGKHKKWLRIRVVGGRLAGKLGYAHSKWIRRTSAR